MNKKIPNKRRGHSLTPLLRPKAKKKPRGKPFAKGNRVGVATRFAKGTSPNPGGRPRSAEVSKASREWLAEPVTLAELVSNKLPRELEGLTHAEVITFVRGLGALGGSLADAQELADRAEGRPGTRLAIENTNDPLSEIVRAMNNISEKIGPPVGDPIPEDAEGDDKQ